MEAYAILMAQYQSAATSKIAKSVLSAIDTATRTSVNTKALAAALAVLDPKQYDNHAFWYFIYACGIQNVVTNICNNVRNSGAIYKDNQTHFLDMGELLRQATRDLSSCEMRLFLQALKYAQWVPLLDAQLKPLSDETDLEINTLAKPKNMTLSDWFIDGYVHDSNYKQQQIYNNCVDRLHAFLMLISDNDAEAYLLPMMQAFKQVKNLLTNDSLTPPHQILERCQNLTINMTLINSESFTNLTRDQKLAIIATIFDINATQESRMTCVQKYGGEPLVQRYTLLNDVKQALLVVNRSTEMLFPVLNSFEQVPFAETLSKFLNGNIATLDAQTQATIAIYIDIGAGGIYYSINNAYSRLATDKVDVKDALRNAIAGLDLKGDAHQKLMKTFAVFHNKLQQISKLSSSIKAVVTITANTLDGIDQQLDTILNTRLDSLSEKQDNLVARLQAVHLTVSRYTGEWTAENARAICMHHASLQTIEDQMSELQKRLEICRQNLKNKGFNDELPHNNAITLDAHTRYVEQAEAFVRWKDLCNALFKLNYDQSAPIFQLPALISATEIEQKITVLEQLLQQMREQLDLKNVISSYKAQNKTVAGLDGLITALGVNYFVGGVAMAQYTKTFEAIKKRVEDDKKIEALRSRLSASVPNEAGTVFSSFVQEIRNDISVATDTVAETNVKEKITKLNDTITIIKSIPKSILLHSNLGEKLRAIVPEISKLTQVELRRQIQQEMIVYLTNQFLEPSGIAIEINDNTQWQAWITNQCNPDKVSFADIKTIVNAAESQSFVGHFIAKVRFNRLVDHLSQQLGGKNQSLTNTLKQLSTSYFAKDQSSITEADIADFKTACEKAINAECNTLKDQGLWFNLHPIFRAIIGILATITVIPAVAVACFSSQGYKNTFFGVKPGTKELRHLNAFKSALTELRL